MLGMLCADFSGLQRTNADAVNRLVFRDTYPSIL